MTAATSALSFGTLPPAPPTTTDPRLAQAYEGAGGLEELRGIFKRFG